MYFKKFKIRNRNRRGGPKGAAAVEAALCIPAVIILMFGTLETCSSIFLSESLKIVAYEGARVGVRRGATAERVSARCQEILTARQVTGATITVVPTDFSELDALEPISVTVSAPYNGNSRFVFSVFGGRTNDATVSMMREFDD